MSGRVNILTSGMGTGPAGRVGRMVIIQFEAERPRVPIASQFRRKLGYNRYNLQPGK